MATRPVHRITLPYVSPWTSELLLWRNPRTSGAYLGVATALLALPLGDIVFGLLGFNRTPPLLAVTAYLLMVAIGGLNLWSIISNLTGRAHPPVPALLLQGISEEAAKEYGAAAATHLNPALVQVGRIASGQDPKLSLQVVAGLFAVAWLLSKISIFACLYTVILLAFSVPKFYEMTKDDTDKYIGKATVKAKELYAKVDDAVFKKIPKGGARKTQ